MIHTILQAAGLRNFAGPDGKPFLDAPPGQIRLVWSFSADSFNPFFNREAKQTVSSTGIFILLTSDHVNTGVVQGFGLTCTYPAGLTGMNVLLGSIRAELTKSSERVLIPVKAMY